MVEIKTLYLQEFNIDKYLRQYYSSIDEEEAFFLKQLDKINQTIEGLLYKGNQMLNALRIK